MPRVVISTLGTSLLTSQINRNSDPSSWFNILRQSANYTTIELEKYSPQAQDIIHVLKEKAIKNLNEGNIRNIRLASTELSVIYALYQGNLEQGKQDYHFLIASDTAISTETANIIQSFLSTQGLNVQIYQPKGFSTASSETFNNGIDELLVWLDNVASNYSSAGYCISFNLVASSRVLQAYMDIIGMLYAHELIYVLEGAKPTLINIPKIPIKLDDSIIDPVKFALMEIGSIDVSQITTIPEIFIYKIDNKAILSNWGTLIWKRCKADFLSRDLLYFPGLAYETSFISDFKKIRDLQYRVKLQETLAKVSDLLTKASGDISILKTNTGLDFVKFVHVQRDIYHFRVNQKLRVSCVFSNGILGLRRYGSSNYVINNP
ncbi:CRISPR-associated protein [Scytonema tolypothrichoides VB-61278]|nr:CRISPR-associated protein [Scytonema tolypothrichoides VB-61278]